MIRLSTCWNETGRVDAVEAAARAPFIDAQALKRTGVGGKRNAAAASNDRARVASFTRSAGRRTTAEPPSASGPYYMALDCERRALLDP